MTTLNGTQLSALRAIQNIDEVNFTTQHAIDYYTYLENAGISYGALPLGVVQNNTDQGAVANIYAASVAASQSVDFSVGNAN